MASEPVTVERIDYARAFGATRLFRGFRMAIQPSKLLLALLLVVLVFGFGRVLDAVWGPRVLPGEFQYSVQSDPGNRAAWRENRRAELANQLGLLLMRHGQDAASSRELAERPDAFRQARLAITNYYEGRETSRRHDLAEQPERLESALADLATRRHRALNELNALSPDGVFETALGIKLQAFSNLVYAAVQVRPGFEQLSPREVTDPTTVLGALRTVVVVLPSWLWHFHPWFLIVQLIGFLLVWSLLAGTISRIAVVEAARDERPSPTAALRFAFSHWPGFILAPLIPAVLVLVIGLVLAVGGLIFFNLPLLDILGGLLFIFALAGGVVMALLLVGLVGGVHLMYPALSAEGTDAFDALSRSFSYLYARPWRLIAYSFVALVYGAATYLFVSLFIFLSLWLTHVAVDAWVVREATDGLSRFSAMFHRPEFGELIYTPEFAALGISGKVSAVLVMVWVYLIIGVLAAYAISYYLSAYSVIYLLMRRRCDGTDVAEVFLEPEPSPLDAPDETDAPPEPRAESPDDTDANAPDAEASDRSADGPGESTGKGDDNPSGDEPPADESRGGGKPSA